MSEFPSSYENANLLKLVPPHNEVLNLVAKKILDQEILQNYTQRLIENMIHIARGEQGDPQRRTMVGLAAPQLGISRRIIVVDVASTGMGETPDLRVYINPYIISMSDEIEQGREGCFSTGNVCGNVDRAREVTIKAIDSSGHHIQEVWSGFTARIFQHEIDHLDGIRFPDRITDDTKLHWVEQNEFGKYRTEWTDWTRLCPRSKWKDIKDGIV